jgi:hypothetical protein
VTREHVEGDAGERELIRARVDLLREAEGLLRRHELRRSHDDRPTRQVMGRVRALRDAEVEHLDEVVVLPVSPQEEDVRWLEVAVHDTERVRGAQRRSRRLGDANGGVEGHRTHVREAGLEIDAVEILHDEVRQPLARGVEVEDLDDVGVPQRRHDLGLAAESRDGLLARQERDAQDLDREAPGEADVCGLVDLAHPTVSDARSQRVRVLQHDAREVRASARVGARRERLQRAAGHLDTSLRKE